MSDTIALPEVSVELAKEMANHLLRGAWARDDAELLGLAEAVAPSLDAERWPNKVTLSEAQLIAKLLRKAADSDWSWEVSTLTGRDLGEFSSAFAQLPTSLRGAVQ